MPPDEVRITSLKIKPGTSCRDGQWDQKQPHPKNTSLLQTLNNMHKI